MSKEPNTNIRSMTLSGGSSGSQIARRVAHRGIAATEGRAMQRAEHVYSTKELSKATVLAHTGKFVNGRYDDRREVAVQVIVADVYREATIPRSAVTIPAVVLDQPKVFVVAQSDGASATRR